MYKEETKDTIFETFNKRLIELDVKYKQEVERIENANSN